MLPGLRRPLLTRRHFLAASGIAALAAAAEAVWWEPNRIRVSRHTLGTESGARPPLRIVQLSDLHLRHIDRHAERIARTVHDLAPDLLLLTGDVIDRGDALSLLDTFLALLPRTSHAFAILGNWEHWARVDLAALERLYETHAIELLVNRSVRITHHGTPMLLTGLDDATGGTPDLAAALRDAEPAVNHLLLAHSPAYHERLHVELQRIHDAARPAPGDTGAASTQPPVTHRFTPDCMLSGHTHGGQINLFGWAPFRPPGSGTYVHGWYHRDEQPALYVSAGLGTSVVPVRFGATPEIAVFTWHLRG